MDQMTSHWSMEVVNMSLKGIWNKITIVLAVPLGLGFVVLAIFGQICLENLPYLTCGGN